MRIRMLKTMAGPEGVRQEGQRFEVGDDVGTGLIDAGVAERISDVAAARAATSEAEDGDLQGEVVALREQVATLQAESKKPASKKLDEANAHIVEQKKEIERLQTVGAEVQTENEALKARVEELETENAALKTTPPAGEPSTENAGDTGAAGAEHATEPRQG